MFHIIKAQSEWNAAWKYMTIAFFFFSSWKLHVAKDNDFTKMSLDAFEFVNSFFMATRWRIASMRRFSLSNKSSGNPSLMKQPKIYEAQKLHTKAKSAHLMQIKCPPKCSCIQRNQKHAHQMNLSHSSKTSYFINGVRANGVAYWMQSSCGTFWNVKNLLYIFLQSHTHTLW